VLWSDRESWGLCIHKLKYTWVHFSAVYIYISQPLVRGRGFHQSTITSQYVSTILIYFVSISQVEVIHNCSILATVGLRMASTPGVSATLFDALAKVFCILNLLPEIFFMVAMLISNENDGSRQILM
jgi:hypothetical protein